MLSPSLSSTILSPTHEFDQESVLIHKILILCLFKLIKNYCKLLFLMNIYLFFIFLIKNLLSFVSMKSSFLSKENKCIFILYFLYLTPHKIKIFVYYIAVIIIIIIIFYILCTFPHKEVIALECLELEKSNMIDRLWCL